MGQTILHVLKDDRGIATYPSVYNAAYLWKQVGYRNLIATGSDLSDLHDLFETHYYLSKTTSKAARELSRIEEEVDITIVYEPPDILAYEIARELFRWNNGSKLIIHSLEIPFTEKRQMGLFYVIKRKLFERAIFKANAIVIQDEQRKQLFASIARSAKNKQIFLVPNSYIQEIEPIAVSVPWFDDIRLRFNTVILYIGSIEHWAINRGLLNVASRFGDVAFVFSGWSRDCFVDKLREIATSRHIFFHQSILSRAELNYIVKYSDIGLVTYTSKSANIEIIGQSSGKLHKYLSFGHPVIVFNSDSLKEFVEYHGFGIGVDDSMSEENLNLLLRKCKEMHTNISISYKSIFNFKRSYGEVIRSFK